MTTGHIDHGDLPDMVVSGTATNQIGVVLNYDGEAPSGEFSLSTAAQPGPVAACDLNGDGTDDILVIQDAILNVFFSRGDGSFRPRQDYLQPYNLNSFAVKDINGDGRPDVVAVGTSYKQLLVLINYLGVTFLPERMYPTFTQSTNPDLITLADINSDGKDDAVVGFNGGYGLSTMFGDGTGAFTFGQELSPGAPASILVSDLNLDGSPDIAYGSNGIGIFYNQGGGVFTQSPSLVTAVGSWRNLGASDLTGDGIPDLAAVDDSRHILSVFAGVGGGALTEPVFYHTHRSPTLFSRSTSTTTAGPTSSALTRSPASFPGTETPRYVHRSSRRSRTYSAPRGSRSPSRFT